MSDRLEEAIALLRDIERACWSLGGNVCPCCGRKYGHEPSCRLDAFLKPPRQDEAAAKPIPCAVPAPTVYIQSPFMVQIAELERRAAAAEARVKELERHLHPECPECGLCPNLTEGRAIVHCDECVSDLQRRLAECEAAAGAMREILRKCHTILRHKNISPEMLPGIQQRLEDEAESALATTAGRDFLAERDALAARVKKLEESLTERQPDGTSIQDRCMLTRFTAGPDAQFWYNLSPKVTAALAVRKDGTP